MSMCTPYLLVGQTKLQSKAKHTYLTTGSLTKLQILVWRILASASVPFYKSEIFMEIIFPMWHFVWHLIVFGAGLPTKYNIYRVVPTPSQPADHRNGRTTRLRDYIDSTNSWPQKWANDKVEGLRRLYYSTKRLTREMGEMLKAFWQLKWPLNIPACSPKQDMNNENSTY